MPFPHTLLYSLFFTFFLSSPSVRAKCSCQEFGGMAATVVPTKLYFKDELIEFNQSCFSCFLSLNQRNSHHCFFGSFFLDFMLDSRPYLHKQCFGYWRHSYRHRLLLFLLVYSTPVVVIWEVWHNQRQTVPLHEPPLPPKKKKKKHCAMRAHTSGMD